MIPLTTKKEVQRITLLFTITYMVSYMTRINYGAIVSEMASAEKLSKSMLSLALTGSFITYGTGQIISGVCGDRFSPKKLVFGGLLVTMLMNLLIPFCQNPYQMLAVWCINGFAQSFLWPPLVRLMTTLLSEEDYKRTSVKVSWGSSFGTILVYLISPLIISVMGWRKVFLFSAACAFVMAFVWNRTCYDIPTLPKGPFSQENKKGTSFFTPLMLSIMAAIVLQGMLRDGVTTWMPSYIAETYHLSNSISILSGVVLPLFGILCFQLASTLYRSVFQNPLLCSGVIFGVGALSAVSLLAISGKNAAFSILFAAMLTGCMHGVNLILICMVPPFFKKSGNVGTVSGILNACTYIGSAISTYGTAFLSEQLDWNYTLFLWILIAAIGAVICLENVRAWDKKWG